ncbi:lytic murein transglycosylase [Loktanella sp. F6476L]|uniref:lytic murein transglycosylase n=1 Tax=Loktanella sp. F6476L TaxID=2926405 RepID=UPI001FF46279|nr:lytic murein transglycosylase [Loktanella sp. F6476L]MCK0120968.1 lytic murein transglycosylase [Loktanella sp. F6476L]
MAQNRNAVAADFQVWLGSTVWPKAQRAGVSRSTFETALSGVTPKWDLPDLVIPGERADTTQRQAEFRPPAGYFAAGSLNTNANTGRQLMQRHAQTLARIERQTGVPAQIIVAIWGRESSFGNARIPHNAFQILSTKGFLSTRASYFTNELIAALQMVERGYASPAAMKSSWAGALGQPQFMPSNYLKYAADGNGDGRADIWGSADDTLASIGAYLRDHGWSAGRDWGFEVNVPNTVSCAMEGPHQARRISDWAAMGITRVNGRSFPAAEARENGFLLMPAGRYGPAFVVTSNFTVLKAYNESDVYALFVGHVGDRMRYGVGGFNSGWSALDSFARSDVRAMQQKLEAQGYDVGGADGLIGNKTRGAIGAWQTRNGMAATCYPNRAMLAAIAQQ